MQTEILIKQMRSMKVANIQYDSIKMFYLPDVHSLF